jgi:hypothetical protein
MLIDKKGQKIENDSILMPDKVKGFCAWVGWLVKGFRERVARLVKGL